MRRIFSSATVKLVALLMFAAFCLMACLNTLPLILSKKMTLSSAEELLSAEAKNISAILSASADESGGNDLLSRFTLDTTGADRRILLIDRSGEVLVDTAVAHSRVGSYLLTDNFAAARSGETVFYSETTESVFRYSVMTPFSVAIGSQQSAVLCVTQSDAAAAAGYCNLRDWLARVSLVLLLIFAALSLWICIRFATGTKRLLVGMHEIRKGNFKYRISTGTDQEFAQIGQGLNELCETFAATDERRRRFVSDASHELKTPLATVKLLSDSIIQTPNMDREEIVEFLTDISNEIDRLTRISSGMLSLAKLDDTSLSTFKEPLDLAAVAATVCRMLSPLAQASDCRIRHELTTKIFFTANYDSIYQIFYNLIENSIKYGSKGKEVRVFLYVRDGFAHFIVDDDGDGIPPEDLRRIFDRFYRVDKARARATGGTGLGLSIVASSVKACGGTVEAQNRQGGGARFIVKFPLSEETSFTDFADQKGGTEP